MKHKQAWAVSELGDNKQFRKLTISELMRYSLPEKRTETVANLRKVAGTSYATTHSLPAPTSATAGTTTRTSKTQKLEEGESTHSPSLPCLCCHQPQLGD